MNSWTEGALALVIVFALGVGLFLFTGQSLGDGGTGGTTPPIAVDPVAAERGQALAEANGCLQCHTTDGRPGSGPTWKGLAGSARPLASGEEVVADDAYLFNSIIDTIDRAIAVVDGFGQGSLLDQDLPIIGASARDGVSWLGDVRDTVNEIAQKPAGSLQRLEAEIELAIAEALGVDTSSVPPLPDPNDPQFYTNGPDGNPGTGDELFGRARCARKLPSERIPRRYAGSSTRPLPDRP